jgi:hypothetical protein
MSGFVKYNIAGVWIVQKSNNAAKSAALRSQAPYRTYSGQERNGCLD